ncbi:unnamed protein product [Allacma fusca]|uniref:C2H2-type domain-containing protein n=1 Tax=Allacma fusca TaxID=39272 RepID=A0A8J2MEQ7_9HEXA|nr:unnamed protein product [Allacma fusca]
MSAATSPAININENSFWSSAIKHQKLLENWQKELAFQTTRFFQNVDEFQIFVQQAEVHLQKQQRHLQQESQALANVQGCFHLILCRIENILEIKKIQNAELDSPFIDRLTEILRKIHENQSTMEESMEEKNNLKAALKYFWTRDEKLHSLSNKLKWLSTELESVINQSDEVCPSNLEFEDVESTTTPIENIKGLLQEAHEDLESYCTHRRNRDNELFKRNYIRFKRSNCEALNQFLNLVEKELFHLWIQEDRNKLSYNSKYKSTLVQTEPENPGMINKPQGNVFNTQENDIHWNEFEKNAESKESKSVQSNSWSPISRPNANTPESECEESFLTCPNSSNTTDLHLCRGSCHNQCNNTTPKMGREEMQKLVSQKLRGNEDLLHPLLNPPVTDFDSFASVRPSVSMPCIICDQNVTLGDAKDHFDEIETGESSRKYILLNFCRHFQINFSVPSEQWDLIPEDLKFCGECQTMAEKLVELTVNLEILKRELSDVEGWVKARIKNISALQLNRSTLKAWKSENSGVEAIRDIIVGPVLRLPRVPITTTVTNFLAPISVKTESAGADEGLLNNYSPGSNYSSPGYEIVEIKEEGLNSQKKTRKKRGKYLKKSKRAAQPEFKIRTKISAMKNQPKTSSCEELTEDVQMDHVSNEVLKQEAVENATFDSGLNDEFLRPRRARKSKLLKSESFSEDDIDDSKGEEGGNASTIHDDDSCNEDGLLQDGDYFEDDDDEDFIPPDEADADGNVSEDKKLESKIKSSLRAKNSQIDRKSVVLTKVTNLGNDRYLYGDHLEFTGNLKEGFKCSLCTKDHVFRLRRHICTHLREKHLRERKSFVCQFCGKSLGSDASLKYHLQSHNDSSDAVCEVCGKVCKGAMALVNHVKVTHGKDCSGVCEICGARFKYKNRLNDHVKTVHLKEKRYFCEICGRGFYGKYQMKIHIEETHSTVKQFTCKLCGEKFRQRSSWWRHMAVFHNSRPSGLNAVDVQSKYGKDESAEQKSGDPDLRCKFCGLQYNRHNNLTRHLKQIHHINVKGLSWKNRPPKRLLEQITLLPEALGELSYSDEGNFTNS